MANLYREPAIIGSRLWLRTSAIQIGIRPGQWFPDSVYIAILRRRWTRFGYRWIRDNRVINDRR